MIEKLLNWAKTLPWWISWLVLLLLVPVFLFWVLKAQGKGQELAKVKHEKDLIEEDLQHAEKLKRLDLAEEEKKKLELQEEDLARRKTETNQLLVILEKDQQDYRDRINGVTSWDELK